MTRDYKDVRAPGPSWSSVAAGIWVTLALAFVWSAPFWSQVVDGGCR